jgi:hypothetical protein
MPETNKISESELGKVLTPKQPVRDEKEAIQAIANNFKDKAFLALIMRSIMALHPGLVQADIIKDIEDSFDNSNQTEEVAQDLVDGGVGNAADDVKDDTGKDIASQHLANNTGMPTEQAQQQVDASQPPTAAMPAAAPVTPEQAQQQAQGVESAGAGAEGAEMPQPEQVAPEEEGKKADELRQQQQQTKEKPASSAEAPEAKETPTGEKAEGESTPAETPAEQPAEVPAEAPTEQPAEVPAGEPTSAEAPAGEPTETPAEQPTEAPTEEAQAPTEGAEPTGVEEPPATVEPAAEPEAAAELGAEQAATEGAAEAVGEEVVAGAAEAGVEAGVKAGVEAGVKAGVEAGVGFGGWIVLIVVIILMLIPGIMVLVGLVMIMFNEWISKILVDMVIQLFGALDKLPGGGKMGLNIVKKQMQGMMETAVYIIGILLLLLGGAYLGIIDHLGDMSK